MTSDECTAQIEAITQGVGCNHFQQTPSELAQMISLLLSQPTLLANYLEIGAGTGWTAKVMDSFLQFEQVRLIDNGVRYSGRLERVPKALEWVGDSTTLEASQALEAWGIQYDLVYVDGDHSYRSVRSDTFLATKCAKPSCYVAFHDARHGEVRWWLKELMDGALPGLTHVQLFGRKSGETFNLSLFKWQSPGVAA